MVRGIPLIIAKMSIAKTFKAIMFGFAVVSPVSGVKFRRETISACSDNDATTKVRTSRSMDFQSRSVMVSESAQGSSNGSHTGDYVVAFFGLCLMIGTGFQFGKTHFQSPKYEAVLRDNTRVRISVFFCELFEQPGFPLVAGALEILFNCVAMVGGIFYSTKNFDVVARTRSGIFILLLSIYGVFRHRIFSLIPHSLNEYIEWCMFSLYLAMGVGYAGVIAGEVEDRWKHVVKDQS